MPHVRIQIITHRPKNFTVYLTFLTNLSNIVTKHFPYLKLVSFVVSYTRTYSSVHFDDAFICWLGIGARLGGCQFAELCTSQKNYPTFDIMRTNISEWGGHTPYFHTAHPYRDVRTIVTTNPPLFSLKKKIGSELMFFHSCEKARKFRVVVSSELWLVHWFWVDECLFLLRFCFPSRAQRDLGKTITVMQDIGISQSQNHVSQWHKSQNLTQSRDIFVAFPINMNGDTSLSKRF